MPVDVAESGTHVLPPNYLPAEDARYLSDRLVAADLDLKPRDLVQEVLERQRSRTTRAGWHRQPVQPLPDEKPTGPILSRPARVDPPGEATAQIRPPALTKVDMPLPSRAEGAALAAAQEPETRKLSAPTRLLAFCLDALRGAR